MNTKLYKDYYYLFEEDERAMAELIEKERQKTMKTTIKDFSKKLEEYRALSNKNITIKNAFDDFIHLNYLLYVAETEEHSIVYQNSKIYNELINEDFSKKIAPKQLPVLLEASEIYHNLVKQAEPFEDVLGSVYDENLGQVLGQFFTPNDLANNISKIIGKYINKDKDVVNIGDPSGCGGGSLILPQLKSIYKEKGKVGILNTNITGMDIDLKMVQLTAVQILAHSKIHSIPVRSLKLFLGNSIAEYMNAETIFLGIQYRDIELFDMLQTFDKLESALGGNHAA